MHTHKKMLAGFSFVLLLAILVILGPVKKVFAVTQAQLQNATFTVVNPATEIDVSIGGSTIKFVDSNPFDNGQFLKANFKPQSNQFCPSTVFGTPINTGKGITLLANFDTIVANGGSLPARIDVDFLDSSGNCQTYSADILFNKQADGTYSTAASSVNPPTSPPPSSASTTTESCESQGFVMAWAVCPILRGLDGMISAINDLIENQLVFNTNQILPDNGGIHKAWSTIKNLAASLLIIVMLVAIISQAISWGPFDAYTVRKILPKLIAAVIIIQLSWVFFRWTIDVANDAGKGLADIMFAPFGGSANMGLDDIVARIPGFGTASQIGSLGLFGAAIAAGTIGTVFLAAGGSIVLAFAMLAIPVVIAILVGFLVLVFRQILLVLLIMLVPLALVAWILPGTQRYWKLWHETFFALLLMFPIIVGILAAGRIFAFAAAPGTGSAFIAFILVLVAVFAPYFLLPKTFQFGGRILGNLAGTVSNGAKGLSGRPKAIMKERAQLNKDELTRRSRERVATGQGFKKSRFWQYPIDKIKSGQWDPTLGPTLGGEGENRVKQKAYDTYVQKGEASYQEDLNAAETRIVRERQKIRAQGGNHDKFLHAIADGAETYVDDKIGPIPIGKRSAIERTAARKQIATLGAQTNWRYLESYYDRVRDSGSPEEKAEMRKFFDDNVGTIIPKLPHVYTGIEAAATSDQGAIGQMHGVEVESIISNLGKTIHDPSNNGKIKDLGEQARNKAGAEKSLATFLQTYSAAAANPNVHLNLGGLQAVKGFLDKPGGERFRASINEDSYDGRSSRHISELPAADDLTLNMSTKAVIDGLKTSLASKIDPSTGNYTSGTPAAATSTARPISTAAPSPTEVTIVTPPAPTRVETDRGVLEIHHDPSTETISPGGVIQPPTPRPTERTQSPEEEENIRNRTFGGGQSNPPSEEG